MSKKQEKVAVIQLSKDMTLLTKKNTDSKELMTAVGMVSQLFIYGMLEEQGIDGTDKLKQMFCEYVDKIAELIKNNEKK